MYCIDNMLILSVVFGVRKRGGPRSIVFCILCRFLFFFHMLMFLIPFSVMSVNESFSSGSFRKILRAGGVMLNAFSQYACPNLAVKQANETNCRNHPGWQSKS